MASREVELKKRFEISCIPSVYINQLYRFLCKLYNTIECATPTYSVLWGNSFRFKSESNVCEIKKVVKKWITFIANVPFKLTVAYELEQNKWTQSQHLKFLNSFCLSGD